MKFDNTTWNQHYISQAEQRKNAIPGTSDIFEFRVESRDPAILTSPSRVSIRRNLSFDDLFTFAYDGQSIRKNLEDVFGRYENEMWTHASEILSAVKSSQAPPAASVCGLFTAKFMNFLRSPYCVTKVLNTIGSASTYRPADPYLASVYEQVKEQSAGRREDVCERFGLAGAEYDHWLTALFMTLIKDPRADASILEQTVIQTFSSSFVLVDVFAYDSGAPHICLLSDRGFNEPRRDGGMFSLEFNITSKAFVRFSVYSAEVFETEMREKAGFSELQWELARNLGLLTPRVRILRRENDLEALRAYNQLAVYQCAERVFGACASPFL